MFLWCYGLINPIATVGGITGGRKEKDYFGTTVKANVYLGYQIQTDVLELCLKSPNPAYDYLILILILILILTRVKSLQPLWRWLCAM